MKNITLILLVLVAFTVGCASQVKTVDYYKVPTSTLNKIRTMEHLPDSALSDSDYADVGIISGSSCHSYAYAYYGTGSETSHRKIFEQLILRASDMGAENITKPQCEVLEDTNPNDDCTASMMCTSHALKALPRDDTEQI
jgi:hypothetical protein